MLGHPGLAPSVPSLALSHAKISIVLILVELRWLCHLEFSS
jgi:hypothetical protein